MADWKKVVVSGSAISQLDNDAGYLTSVTTQNAFATASFDGTELLANDANGNLTFASSSDQGLTISADAGTDTLTFGLSAIPNTSLANSTISGISLGSNLNNLTDGNGITDFTYNGSSTATVSVQADSTTGGNVKPVSVTANGVGLDVDTIDGTGLSANGSGLLDVDYGSTSGTAVEGDTTITLTQTAGEIDITGTAAQALGGGPSYTIGLADTISGNRTFSGDLITISNDLLVQGTASFQNTENLLVADRFVLFASGSSTAGDGGIVVQQGTQDVGELFGYENTVNRWGFTSSFDAASSTFTPSVYVGAVQTGTGQTAASDAPIYGGASAGYGTIHVDTDDGEIWIYA
jgi:hypothetical protein